MKRRTFTAGALALALAAAPLGVRAQQRVPRIALFSGLPLSQVSVTGDPRFASLFKELKRLGYEEGRQLTIDRYSAEGLSEREYDDLANRIAASRPDLIFVQGSRLAVAAKAATRTIPIIFAGTAPIEFGLVSNLPNPGANITGFAADTGAEFIGKQVSLLLNAIGGASRIAYLGVPQAWLSPGGSGTSVRRAAESLGLDIVPVLVDPITEDSIRTAFAGISRVPGTALYVGVAAEFLAFAKLIAALAIDTRLPAVTQNRVHAEAGLLMAYGQDASAQFAGVADYIDRILKGADPGKLPVQQPMRFELVVNQKTAKTLGITIPESLLVFATEVIE